MIVCKSSRATGSTRVTFVLPDEGTPVSVVGSFNAWDPLANPLKRRSNGTRSAAIEVPSGERIYFRYLYDGGAFADDPEAEIVSTGVGGTESALSF